MPTYDYECDACNHKFELYQGINDEVQKKCPECKKNKLRRLIGTGSAIVFKGSGFYQTDYRSESYKKAKAADSSGGSKSEGGKSEGGKSEGGKSEGGKSEGSKSESGSSKSESKATAKTPKKSSE
jgi:putative FmdB family regulatory protein